MNRNTAVFRYLGLFSYLTLLVWMILWYFVFEPENYSTLFVAVFLIGPLLLPLVGIIKGKPYTYAWANFVVMIYLLHGFTAIYTEDNWLFPLGEIILALAMFIGCAFYARLRGRELGLGLKKNKEKTA